MRYLGIDYGNRRTGVAICDARETIASPLAVLVGQKDLIGRIVRILKKEEVEAIVLGLPLNMDDSEGPQARIVREFASKLQTQISLPIHFQDERLSSFAASEKLDEIGLSWEAKRDRIDALAAAEILQAFLDRTKSQSDQ
jgi:putative holliday junction resolvase